VSGDRARDVYRELQRLARADYGGATGQLLVVYGVEGFLRRLAASTYATRMTLKGGMLMAATATRRMTKDADLSAVGVANDPEHMARVVADIATVELADEDGLVFDVGTIRTEVMREQADYHGIRAKVHASVDSETDGDARLLLRRPTQVGAARSARAPGREHPVGVLPTRADAGREDRHDDEPS